MNRYYYKIFIWGLFPLFFSVNNSFAQETMGSGKSKTGSYKLAKSTNKLYPDSFMYNLLARYPQYFDSIVRKK